VTIIPMFMFLSLVLCRVGRHGSTHDQFRRASGKQLADGIGHTLVLVVHAD